LVTTTGGWNLVDPLLNYLDGLTGGWSQLNGDVLAAGTTGPPTNVAIRASGTSTFDSPSSSPQKAKRVILGGIGVGVLAAVAIAAAALWWRRRSRTRVESPADDEPATTPEPDA
jgi:hypothetical protein